MGPIYIEVRGDGFVKDKRGEGRTGLLMFLRKKTKVHKKILEWPNRNYLKK